MISAPISRIVVDVPLFNMGTIFLNPKYWTKMMNSWTLSVRENIWLSRYLLHTEIQTIGGNNPSTWMDQNFGGKSNHMNVLSNCTSN